METAGTEASPWKPFKSEDGQWYRWRLNGAQACVRRDGGLWTAVFCRIPLERFGGVFQGPAKEDPPSVDEAPAAMETVFFRGKGETVRMRVCLGSRPVVLSTKEPLRISPGSRIRCRAFFPPLVKLELSSGKIIAEFEPFLPPLTFWGQDTMNGEVCGCLPLGFQEGDVRPSSLAVCDISLRNSGKAVTEIREIAVFPATISVWLAGGLLVADDLEIDFLDSGSRQKVLRPDRPDKELLNAGAKRSAGESLARRGAGFIKNIVSV